MRKSIVLGLAMSLSLVAGAAMADGKALYASKGCAACHGADGKSPIAPIYPKLSGQGKSADYLYEQAVAIKNGTRNTPFAPIMKPTISMVADGDIRAIAEWLAAQ